MSCSDDKFVTYSKSLKKNVSHHEVFKGGISHIRPWERPKSGSDITAVVGWGRKKSGMAAQRLATEIDAPFWLLEDGFIRSFGLGSDGERSLSVVVDDIGIYYDGTCPSRLEKIIESSNKLEDENLVRRAERCIQRIVSMRVSKYNCYTEDYTVDKGSYEKVVLVVDQVLGDSSVEYGCLHPSGFHGMLEAALLENPDALVLIKTHPDVISGKKKGYLAGGAVNSRAVVLAENVNPLFLIEQVDHVYVATSQLGFEALMIGKKVTCFATPFYSGWGLTDDRVSNERRKRNRSLAQLFAATYILYSRYSDPLYQSQCEIEDVLDYLDINLRAQLRNKGKIFCFGFSYWKQAYVRSFLKSPGNKVVFSLDSRHALRNGFDSQSKIVVWGVREKDDVRRLADKFGVNIWRMEDGFIRSVGLGSDFIKPVSLVLDKTGIYFDPRSNNDLELILNTIELSKKDKEEAKAIIREVCNSGLTKYQVGEPSELIIKNPELKKIILIPGQVEDDASIRLGGVDIRTNAQLIKAVREKNGDAYLIYKPHPEVVAGNRIGAVDEAVLATYCDQVVSDISLDSCLVVADEVHTITSTVGFDALMRGKKVVVYGIPFYSGWGLTVDKYSVKRRSRSLTIEELVSGSMVKYPDYINWESGRFTSVKDVIKQFALDYKKQAPSSLNRSGFSRYRRKGGFLYSAMKFRIRQSKGRLLKRVGLELRLLVLEVFND